MPSPAAGARAPTGSQDLLPGRSRHPLGFRAGATWAPKGRTPEVTTSGRRQAINTVSAVNARGEFWFKIYAERLNQEFFLRFLQAFLRGRRTPVILVVDGHPAHRARG